MGSKKQCDRLLDLGLDKRILQEKYAVSSSDRRADVAMDDAQGYILPLL